MTVRSLCSYGNTYCMQWVSNKVVTDIRGQLFNKMVRSSMDFFNKMRSGLLISRITNETRVVQMALTAVSSDIFKQPVADHWRNQRSISDGLEIHADHTGSFSNLFAAASHLRAPRAQSAPGSV